jgi:hypothetical protein
MEWIIVNKNEVMSLFDVSLKDAILEFNFVSFAWLSY